MCTKDQGGKSDTGQNCYNVNFTISYYHAHKLHICDALRDLVPFLQLKKREKHPWRSVTFSKVAGHVFLSCTNSTKTHKTSHMMLLFLL